MVVVDVVVVVVVVLVVVVVVVLVVVLVVVVVVVVVVVDFVVVVLVDGVGSSVVEFGSVGVGLSVGVAVSGVKFFDMNSVEVLCMYS